MAAFQAWTLDKARSLADHLEARGDLTSAKRAVLEALAAVHLETHGGDVEQSLAAVPSSRSTRASLASLGEPDIEATLARITRSKNGQATEPDDDDADRTATYSVGTATSDGQRFRILRPHARGGLGAVFVALDGELHREVALKQILEKHADDPVSRQRFVAEAEITGGLEHPGVVPVYGLGTDAGGRPYYAMRFIKGDSLKEAIDRFHKDEVARGTTPAAGRWSCRKLLRRFTDVCNAIDYAHSRGVIHRDLKPANIIVGKHGETLVVDWGLAKAVGRADPSVGEQTLAPSSSGSSETLPGSALGTPAYMSPEQARGELERLGPRSDVYSLGATLYCLLTGKPPFEDEDIGVIFRAVQEGQFPRPSQHDPALDKALEAVCLKAMATEPEDRYPTPKALADDLERWMADEPVTAWREPFCAPGPAVGAAKPDGGHGGRRSRFWLWRRAGCRHGRADAGQHRPAGCEHRGQAGQHRAVRREGSGARAVRPGDGRDQDLSHRRQRGLPAQAGPVQAPPRSTAQVCQRLLRQARVAPGKGVGPGVTTGIAQANFDVAELTAKVGRKEAALQCAPASAGQSRGAGAGGRIDAETQGDVAISLTAVGRMLAETGRADEGLAAYKPRGRSFRN